MQETANPLQRALVVEQGYRFPRYIARARVFLRLALVTIVVAASLLGALACILPWRPDFPEPNLDASWKEVVLEASAQHWQFGKDITFTYGPWAYVALSQYHPSLYGAKVFGPLTLLVALLVLSLWCGVWPIGRNLPQRLLLGTALCWAFTELLLIQYAQDRYLALGYLVIWQTFLLHAANWHLAARGKLASDETAPGLAGTLARTSWTALGYAAIVATAFVSLLKFSHQTLAICVIAGISAADVFYWRRMPWKAIVYAGAWLGFWLAAGQSLRFVPAYLGSSLAISEGYCAMKVSGPEFQIVFYSVVAVISSLLVGTAQFAARRWLAVISVVCTAAVFEVLAKAAFVRHDSGHASIAFCFMAGWWLLSATWLWKTAQTRTRRLLFVLGAHFAGIAAYFFFAPQLAESFDHWGTKRVDLAECACRVLTGKTDYAARYDQAWAAVRARMPIPQMSGTVDLYPDDLAILLAHNARYRPRPILQSYSVYTPMLASMNAAHLRGDRAADNILFDVQPMWTRAEYHRFPSLDDGLSWLELLTRYDVAPREASWDRLPYLWLKRSPQPRKFTLVPLERRTVAFGEAMPIPSLAEGPVWAEIDVPRSLPGTAANIALKDPFVELEVQAGDQAPVNHGLILGSAKAGFLLSPVIGNREWFAWLMTTPWNDPQWQQALRSLAVKQIRVVARNKDRWAFQPTVAVSLYRLKFEPSPVVQCRYPSTAATAVAARSPEGTRR